MKTQKVTRSKPPYSIIYPAPLRTRPIAVTSPITEVILEAAYHCGHHYEHVLKKLAVFGMWISRETFKAYKLAYHHSLG